MKFDSKENFLAYRAMMQKVQTTYRMFDFTASGRFSDELLSKFIALLNKRQDEANEFFRAHCK